MAVRAVMKTVSDKLLLGTCIPCVHDWASKIRVSILEFDDYINMYFKKDLFYYAYDPKKECKTGDIVLIRKLEKKTTAQVTHELIKVVYPLGNIVDPVTGKDVEGRFTREELHKKHQLYGLVKNSFNYDEAPERGWQAGKKDFSDLPVYPKYHEFGKDDDEFNDPYSVP